MFPAGAIYAHTAGLATREMPGPADVQKEMEEKEQNWFIGKLWGAFHEQVFHRNSYLMEISSLSGSDIQ